VVDFSNTTTGTKVSCLWDFGDGGTQASCSSTVAHTYSSTTRRSYDVTLTVNNTSLTRPAYVVIDCKVPSFTGVKKNSAQGVWNGEGFTTTVQTAPGSGNYFINTQSIAGGLVAPAGGCSGAQITVGP